jgi:glycosyltransferase involved in cell wall biosynthesis
MSHPRTKFRIVGQPGSATLMRRIYADTSIEHMEFAEKEDAIYDGMSVLIMCNYKNMGLINRTVQAMACGIVVVGHIGAFNGIEGFCAGKHGFAAENSADFRSILNRCLSNESLLRNVSSGASQLIAGTFSWDTRYCQVNSVLQSLLHKSTAVVV